MQFSIRPHSKHSHTQAHNSDIRYAHDYETSMMIRGERERELNVLVLPLSEVFCCLEIANGKFWKQVIHMLYGDAVVSSKISSLCPVSLLEMQINPSFSLST